MCCPRLEGVMDPHPPANTTVSYCSGYMLCRAARPTLLPPAGAFGLVLKIACTAGRPSPQKKISLRGASQMCSSFWPQGIRVPMRSKRGQICRGAAGP